jgi:hypothetical protein
MKIFEKIFKENFAFSPKLHLKKCLRFAALLILDNVFRYSMILDSLLPKRPCGFLPTKYNSFTRTHESRSDRND